MDNIGTMIVNDESADNIRDAIMTALYTKAAERVEATKPYVVANMFNDEIDDDDYEEDEYEHDEDAYENEDEEEEE